MKNSVPRKSRFWLGAALSVGFLTLLGLQAVSVNLSRNQIREGLELRVTHMSQVSALKVGETVEGTKRCLVLLAASPVVQSLDAGKIQPLLVKYLAQYDTCGNFGVLQTDGFNYVSALPVDSNYFGNLRPWIQRFQHGKLSLGVYVEDQVALTEGVNMALPVGKQTNETSIGVFATIPASTFQTVIKKCFPKEGAVVELFDQNKTIIACNFNPGELRGKKSKSTIGIPPYFQKDEDGQRRLCSVTPVPGAEDCLWVAVGLEADLSKNERLDYIIHSCQIALIFALGGGLVLARRGRGAASSGLVDDPAAVAPVSILSSHPEHLSKNGHPGLSPLAQIIVDASGNVVFFTNPDGIFLGCNTVLEKWLGRSKEKIIGKSAAELFQIELAEHYRKSDTPSQESHEGFDSPFMCADGTSREVKVSMAAIHDGDSNMIGVMSIMVDETERRNLERRIRENEERFRFAVSAAADAIVVMDEHGKVVLWNQAAENLFHYTPEDVIGKDACQLLASPRYHEKWAKHFRAFVEGSYEQVIGKRMELNAVKLDGTEIAVEVFVGAVKLEEKWHTIGMMCDVRDRLVAEESRRDSDYLQGELDAPGTIRGMVEFSKENALLFTDGLLTEMLHVSPDMIGAVGELESAADLWIQHLNTSRKVSKPETFCYEQVLSGVSRQMQAVVKVVPATDGGFSVVFTAKPTDLSLEQQLKRTQFAMDSSPQGVLWADAQGRFTYANASSVSILGHSRDQLLHMSMTDIDRGDSGTWATHWEEVKRRQTFTFESKMQSKSGDDLCLLLTVNYFKVDNSEFACIYVFDDSKSQSSDQTVAFLTSKLAQLGTQSMAETTAPEEPEVPAEAPAEPDQEKLDQALLDELLRGQQGDS